MRVKCDFSGFATKNGIKCTDGRVILKNAFAHQDGAKVPLVWMHQHGSNENLLGYAILENRPEGVYAWCSLNDTKNAKLAKKQLAHGDISSLSIYANQLKQKGCEVVHGMIRELSLVLAGANEGATIDSLYFAHTDDETEDEAIIKFYDGVELSHSALNEEEDDGMSQVMSGQDIVDGMTEDKKQYLYNSVEAALNGEEYSDPDIEEELTDEEAAFITDAVNTAAEGDDEPDDEGDDDEVEEDDEEYEDDGEDDPDYDDDGEDDEDYEEENYMKHDVFMDSEAYAGDELKLTQEQFEDLMKDAKSCGSFREAATTLAHDAFGVEHIDYMFPDYHNLRNGEPELVKKEDKWVSVFLNGATHSPFAKVRYLGADITADEARARGYLKGNRKIEQVYTLTRRTTDPTTVYAKQKFHKDDLTDLAKNWNAVAFTKKTMETVWNYEVARASLIGDGRNAASEDKIDETHIRPVWTDDTFFSYNHTIGWTAAATDSTKASDLIDEMVRARREYKGSGDLTFFTTEDWIDNMMLLKDTVGHRLYKTEEELCAAMRVKRLVPVPDFEGKTRSVTESGSSVTRTLIGIALDCGDYTIGADDGGKISNYEAFDIDYNQQKYLREGRCSGALTRYHSAIVVESKVVTG